MWFKCLCVPLLAASYLSAQTLTTTDSLGETVVEVVTADVNGVPTTEILQTITTPAGQGGPVGAPDSSSTGTTIYIYSTTDANGNTIAVSATFTPTFPATLPLSSITSGTVMAYSDYTAIYGSGQGSLTPVSGSGAVSVLAGALQPLTVGVLSLVAGGLLLFS